MARTSKKSTVTKKFQEEIAKKSPLSLKVLFYRAAKKDPSKLTKEDTKAIIHRMHYLSDEERYKFRYVLVVENLDEEQEERFRRLFTPEKFNKYFPKLANVDAHYATNFTQGRSTIQ